MKVTRLLFLPALGFFLGSCRTTLDSSLSSAAGLADTSASRTDWRLAQTEARLKRLKAEQREAEAETAILKRKVKAQEAMLEKLKTQLNVKVEPGY